LESLWNFNAGYFAKDSANSIYKAANAAKRFAISGLFSSYLRGAHRVVDLCAGRGGDLGRYFDAGVKSVLCIDRDPGAITELISRKFEFAKRDRKPKRQGRSTGTAVLTAVVDLAANTPDQTLDTTKSLGFAEGSADAVVCNFAIHYFCTNSQTLVGVLRTAYRLLKPSGVMILSTMDGESVNLLLSKVAKGDSWKVFEGGVAKYEIRKDYSGDRLDNVGQMIAVRLPMTDELYPEPLANLGYVVAEATRMGMKLEANRSFSDVFDDFAKSKRYLSDLLTADDRAYIALHHYLVMRKRN